VFSYVASFAIFQVVALNSRQRKTGDVEFSQPASGPVLLKHITDDRVAFLDLVLALWRVR